MKNLFQQPDDVLVTAYLNGNNEAFNALLSRHKNKVYTSIFYNVKDRDLAEDIFQETFIKVVTNIKQGRYTENGKFVAWVLRIAHNLIVDHYRQDKGECSHSNDETNVDLFNNKSLCDANVEEEMMQSQIYADVRKLVDALPESQREVIMMRYYDDLSFKEIADKTNVSINTALGRMRYAILNMRKLAADNNMILTL